MLHRISLSTAEHNPPLRSASLAEAEKDSVTIAAPDILAQENVLPIYQCAPPEPRLAS